MAQGPTRDPVKNLPPRDPLFRLPAWAEDHMSILSLSIIGVVVLMTFGLLRSASDSGVTPKNIPPGKEAIVEKVMGPTKILAPGSETMLFALKIVLRNRGPAVAQNMVVSATILGLNYPMAGPSSIAAKGTGEYFVENVNVEPPKDEAPIIQFDCDNCK